MHFHVTFPILTNFGLGSYGRQTYKRVQPVLNFQGKPTTNSVKRHSHVSYRSVSILPHPHCGAGLSCVSHGRYIVTQKKRFVKTFWKKRSIRKKRWKRQKEKNPIKIRRHHQVPSFSSASSSSWYYYITEKRICQHFFENKKSPRLNHSGRCRNRFQKKPTAGAGFTLPMVYYTTKNQKVNTFPKKESPNRKGLGKVFL